MPVAWSYTFFVAMERDLLRTWMSRGNNDDDELSGLQPSRWKHWRSLQSLQARETLHLLRTGQDYLFQLESWNAIIGVNLGRTTAPWSTAGLKKIHDNLKFEDEGSETWLNHRTWQPSPDNPCWGLRGSNSSSSS
jgi:hypothetical protein